MSQGKALTTQNIEQIKGLLQQGYSERVIRALTGFARPTIRKVKHDLVRREEGNFDLSYHVQGVKGEKYISLIDDEVLYVQLYNGYYRILGGRHDRQHLHVYEAKKVYELVDLKWPEEAEVHHIDRLTINTSLRNLAVFDSTSSHMKHHGDMEHAMYAFLFLNDYLPEFYKEYPQLKCQSLDELIVLKLKELKKK